MKTSLWSRIRDAINTYDIDEEFTRQDILKKIGYPTGGSFDLYRLDLTHVGVIEKIGKALYKKKCNIPDNFTTTKLNKLQIELYWHKSWKDWFITLEDRMKSM
jgi:hypothetical protein